MKQLLSITAALLLTVGAAQASQAQGRGAEKGHGPEKHEGRGAERAQRDNGPPGKAKGKAEFERERGAGDDRSPVRIARDDDRGRGREVRPAPPNSRGERGLIAGCPPGLAKRDNGCLPPGQERKLTQARHDWLWARSADGYVQRYDDGYLYRFDRQGGLMGYLPALGGALAVGNIWPVQYRYDPVPRDQATFYRINDSYDYRSTDNAIYAVDPQTSAIRQVVALLTGQSAAVGQPMPSGYDIYNVPYPYRNQYADTAERAYRYNDGAIYQLDPKTQVIQAIIKLLT